MPVRSTERSFWFADTFYDAGWLSNHRELDLDQRSVYRADPIDDDEWSPTQITYDTTNPKGILVSPNDEWLYIAQSDAIPSFVVLLFDDRRNIPTITLRIGKWLPKEIFETPAISSSGDRIWFVRGFTLLFTPSGYRRDVP